MLRDGNSEAAGKEEEILRSVDPGSRLTARRASPSASASMSLSRLLLDLLRERYFRMARAARVTDVIAAIPDTQSQRGMSL